MSTTQQTTARGPLIDGGHVYSPLEPYWNAFQQWRKRQKLLASLYDLSDRELMDVGITRGEIDYVATHRGGDPRGILSGK